MDKREKQTPEVNINNAENAADDEVKATAQAFAQYLREKGIKPNELTRDEIKEILLRSPVIATGTDDKASVASNTSNTSDASNDSVVTKESDISKNPEEQKSQSENSNSSEKRKKSGKKKNSKKSKKSEKAKKDNNENKQNKKSAKKDKKAKKAKTKDEKKSFGIQDIFAGIINSWDRLQDFVCDFLHDQWMSIALEYHKTVTVYKNTLKKAGASMITIALLTSAILLVIEQCTVYEYAYNGRVLGYVEEQTVVTDVLEVAGEHLSKNNNMEIVFSADNLDDGQGNITFKKTSSEGKTTDDADQVVNKLSYMSDIETTAYGIYEDGRLLTIVKSENIANRVLDTVKNMQTVTDKGMTLVSASFNKKIEIQPVEVMLSSILDDQDAVNLLANGGDSKIYHIMNEGETLSEILKTFGVTRKEIYDANNENVLSTYESGDKICIRKTTKPIEVKVVEDGTMSEVVKYKTIKKKTDKMYKGDTVVKQDGINGKQIITGTITKINGSIVDRDIENTEVLKKVQDKIVLVGTAKRPKTEPTGIFGNPLKGSYVITSRVGARWGRTHEGIDFGISSGTPVYASDGGTVTVAGYSGAYGILVEIRHNDGYISRYGHCSSVTVKPGDKVYKGQQISYSGNTGRSTGPHLHFEIRKNGSVIDPGPIIGVY